MSYNFPLASPEQKAVIDLLNLVFDQLLADRLTSPRSYNNMLRSPFLYYNTDQHTY